MVGDILQPTHLLFVLVVALLVLGPKRLPEVGKTLGSGIRDFRSAINGDSSGDRAPREEPETIYAPPEERHQPADEPEDAVTVDEQPAPFGYGGEDAEDEYTGPAVAVEAAPSADEAPPPLSVAREPSEPRAQTSV